MQEGETRAFAITGTLISAVGGPQEARMIALVRQRIIGALSSLPTAALLL